MKKMALATACFFIVGCQSFNTNYISINAIESSRRITNENAHAAIPPAATPRNDYEACVGLVIPVAPDTPPLPVALLKKYAATNRKAYDELMLKHVKELRVHIKQYKLVIERARLERMRCYTSPLSNK